MFLINILKKKYIYNLISFFIYIILLSPSKIFVFSIFYHSHGYSSTFLFHLNIKVTSLVMIKYLQPTSPSTCRRCRAPAPLGFPSLSKSPHYCFRSIKREVVSTHTRMRAHTLREKEREVIKDFHKIELDLHSLLHCRIISHALQV